MRIKVKAEGHNINIPIPTGLIFSKPAVWLYMKLARRYSGHAREYISADTEQVADKVLSHIPDEAVYALCAELMRIKKKYGKWDLVEVKTASGEEVNITL